MTDSCSIRSVRLVVQIVVALIAIFGAGLVVETIGAPFFTGVIEMGWLAIPFSILVFVGGINAWNMIDGIDGLASVLAFIALAFLLVVAGPSAPALQASLLALLCGIGAFFLFNLPFHGLRRHRTFLGDAGSMFLGLAIVWHALALSQGDDCRHVTDNGAMVCRVTGVRRYYDDPASRA